MHGFIALTNQEWINNQINNNGSDAVFWRKQCNFKALSSGEPFYFLKRGHFESNNDRFIVGKGVFSAIEVLFPTNAWEKYHAKLGYATKEDFLAAVRSVYKEENPALGCIILRNVCFFDRPVSLSAARIDFSQYIVSGKTISAENCSNIDCLSFSSE